MNSTHRLIIVCLLLTLLSTQTRALAWRCCVTDTISCAACLVGCAICDAATPGGAVACGAATLGCAAQCVSCIKYGSSSQGLQSIFTNISVPTLSSPFSNRIGTYNQSLSWRVGEAGTVSVMDPNVTVITGSMSKPVSIVDLFKYGDRRLSPTGHVCTYGVATKCMSNQECIDACRKYYNSDKWCLYISRVGKTTGCCQCDVDCPACSSYFCPCTNSICGC